jgi:hypothetical protein
VCFNELAMQRLESAANRLCAEQLLSLTNEEQCEIKSVNFTFMVWDHTAHGVRMGCVRAGDANEMVFVVSYDSAANGKRLFMGTPFCVDAMQCRTLASERMVNRFLLDANSSACLQTDVVFDGSLAVDKPVSLHLQFDYCHEGRSLRVENVAECDNVLLVIDMFQ